MARKRARLGMVHCPRCLARERVAVELFSSPLPPDTLYADTQPWADGRPPGLELRLTRTRAGCLADEQPASIDAAACFGTLIAVDIPTVKCERNCVGPPREESAQCGAALQDRAAERK
jgi:hypothetical protein